jgi:hypothetical protein
MAVRRSTWDALGGFGWRFDGVYGEEDLEFHRRAGAAGLRYASAAPFGCALHVGLFYGNRQKEGLVGGGGSVGV